MEGLRRHQSVSRVRLHVLTPDMTYVEQRMWQKAEILRVEGWLGVNGTCWRPLLALQGRTREEARDSPRGRGSESKGREKG